MLFGRLDEDNGSDPQLFLDSNGYPVSCMVNVLYPWTTWDAVNAALAAGRNWGWFGGCEILLLRL